MIPPIRCTPRLHKELVIMRESWSSDVDKGLRARMARLLNVLRPSVNTAILATAVLIGVGAGAGSLADY